MVFIRFRRSTFNHTLFGDSLFFIALLNQRDQFHERARKLEAGEKLHIVTTRWILAEVADALAVPPWRESAAMFIHRSASSPRMRVIHESDLLFDRGFALYRQRADKNWSLTDCISFIVMGDEGLTDALTGDHHFEQVGFTALLAAPG